MNVFFEEGFDLVIVGREFFGVDCDDVGVGVATIVCSDGGDVLLLIVRVKRPIKKRSRKNDIMCTFFMYSPRIWASLGSTASLGSHGTEMAG